MLLPLLLILVGLTVFGVCIAKIMGESKKRANEWLEQQLREHPFSRFRETRA